MNDWPWDELAIRPVFPGRIANPSYQDLTNLFLRGHLGRIAQGSRVATICGARQARGLLNKPVPFESCGGRP
ncbi:MAG: hypothetical protein NTY19_33940 [Planctomycetota bacterium]|nr:hypothetical protein [Planctomycetota bacterium]